MNVIMSLLMAAYSLLARSLLQLLLQFDETIFDPRDNKRIIYSIKFDEFLSLLVGFPRRYYAPVRLSILIEFLSKFTAKIK